MSAGLGRSVVVGEVGGRWVVTAYCLAMAAAAGYSKDGGAGERTHFRG